MRPKVRVWITFGDDVKFGEGRARLLEARHDLTEHAVVCGLAQHPDMATSTEELFEAAWGALCRATPSDPVVVALDESGHAAAVGVRADEESLELCSNALVERGLFRDSARICACPFLSSNDRQGTGRSWLENRRSMLFDSYTREA